jgi:hypothetical protein
MKSSLVGYVLFVYIMRVKLILHSNHTVAGSPTQAGIPVTEIINVLVTGPGGITITGQLALLVIMARVLSCLYRANMFLVHFVQTLTKLFMFYPKK